MGAVACVRENKMREIVVNGILVKTERSCLTGVIKQASPLGSPDFVLVTGLEGSYDDGTVFIAADELTQDTDWPVYLTIDVMDWHDATGEDDLPQWSVTLCAVSPEAGAKELQAAMAGMEDVEYSSDIIRLRCEVEALRAYGVKAPLATFWSNDVEAAVGAAMCESHLVSSMFGFYMDRQINAIGSTGWDWIQGNVGASLRR